MVEIGVIGGDGIGPEVVRAGMEVLQAAAGDDPSLELGLTEFPWGCQYYLEHGRMMPEDGLDTLAAYDEIYREISSEYPEVEASLMHADALAARLVLAPHSFDVVVGSNLFGDLLSEITAAVAGAIGIAPSANLNPEGTYPSLFEPIHGSAPDITDEGTANPSGAIWAGAMMLEHAGFPEAGARVLAALEETLASGTKTSDLGGTATTDEMAEAVAQRLRDYA